MATNLYLIRHGQAISSIEGSLENTRLSSLGVKQAERLRDRLAATREIQADVLISSTMHRARHTAEIIAPALDLPVTYNEEVEEWRDGDYQDMDQNARLTIFKTTPIVEWPYVRIAPNAETWAEFNLRMGTALTHIAERYDGKTIVIVCHGGIIDGSFQLFFGLSTLQFPRASLGGTKNTSITHWRRDESEEYSIPPTWYLEQYNDIMHLRDLNASVRIPWQEISVRSAKEEDKPELPTDSE